ncbi:MAG: phosphatase PAP2 family protein [Trebonia sp.]
MTRRPQPHGASASWSAAQRVTYLLEPKNWIIVTVVAVGWHAGGAGGLAWGVLAALFAAVVPTLFVTRGIRDGKWTDRNVGDKRPRLIVLSFITASVALGLLVLAAGGAPRELTGYFACMLVSVAILAAITTVWKISIHCAVASGSVTILVLLFGPWVTPAYALVALTAWSRVALRDHTVAQVIAGGALGALAAVASYAIITRSLFSLTTVAAPYSSQIRAVLSTPAVASSRPSWL